MEEYCSLEYDIYLSVAMTGQTNEVRRVNTEFGAGLREECRAIGLRVFDPEELEELHGPFDGDLEKENALFEAFETAIEQSRLVIVLIDGPSTGVGVETAYAKLYRKPIIVVSRDFNSLSLMLKANPQIICHVPFKDVQDTLHYLMTLIEKKLDCCDANTLP